MVEKAQKRLAGRSNDLRSEVPVFEQWHQLWQVASNLDLIVEDAFSGWAPPSAPGPRGLLDFAQVGSDLEAADHRNSVISRLKSGSSVFGIGDPHVISMRQRLEEIIPDVVDLGNDRHERLVALRMRVEELIAFRWLASTSHYPSACKTLRTLVKRGTEGYEGDATDFKLLSATSSWMMQWSMRRIDAHPTRSDLQKASQNAKGLLRFVKGARGLFLRERLSYFDVSDLKKLASELAVLERSYKRPKASDPIAEADYAHLLIRLLNVEFGSASPSIVEHLLGLIGYLPDRDRVKELIRSVPMTPVP